MRDAVLAEIPPLRLARLHRRAADALLAAEGDRPDAAEPIAFHRFRAASIDDPLVVARAGVRAADVARWRGALDAADHFAEQALEVLAPLASTPVVDDVRVEALEAIVGSAYRRGAGPAYGALSERVLEFADRTSNDAARAVALFLRWGDVDCADDLADLADGAHEAAALATRTSDGYAALTARYMVGALAFLSGEIERADAEVERGIAALDTPDADTRPAHVPLVLAPVVAGLTAALRNDRERSYEHTDRRARAWMAQRIEVDPATENDLAFGRALVRAVFADPADTLRQLGSLDPAERGHFVGHEAAVCEVLGAWARAASGQLDALHDLTGAIDATVALPERVLESFVHALGADALLRLGRPGAQPLLETARRLALDRGEIWWLPEIHRLQALVLAGQGERDRAREWLDAAESEAARQGSSLLLDRARATRRELEVAPEPAG